MDNKLTPIIGGRSLPSQLVSTDSWDDVAPADDLGRQAYWLLKFNSTKIALKFRQSDLMAMDETTKRLLISDIQSSLGVSPFKSDTL